MASARKQSSCKVAIVTGGVSGIGAELTTTLIKRGWEVVALDIASQSHHAKQLADDLGEAFEFMPCDVSRYAELAQCFAKTFELKGRIDAFCSNAGIIDQSSIYLLNEQKEIPPEPDTSCTDVCFKALIYGTQLACHFMPLNPTPGGCIVATSSVCALYGHTTFPEYSGAKAAINAFVQSCAPLLWLRKHITINAVCPGTVPTRHIDRHMQETVGADNLTPASTIATAYLRFLEDPALNGQVVECSLGNVFVVDKTPYINGQKSKLASMVYEPFFKRVHGDFSGLDDVMRHPGEP